jgi:hypothetical protein
MLPNHHLKNAAALTLALAAIAPATATAKPVGPDPAGASYAIPQTPVVRVTTPRAGLTGATPASAPPAASPSRCSASAARSPSRAGGPAAKPCGGRSRRPPPKPPNRPARRPERDNPWRNARAHEDPVMNSQHDPPRDGTTPRPLTRSRSHACSFQAKAHSRISPPRAPWVERAGGPGTAPCSSHGPRLGSLSRRWKEDSEWPRSIA